VEELRLGICISSLFYLGVVLPASDGLVASEDVSHSSSSAKLRLSGRCRLPLEEALCCVICLAHRALRETLKDVLVVPSPCDLSVPCSALLASSSPSSLLFDLPIMCFCCQLSLRVEVVVCISRLCTIIFGRGLQAGAVRSSISYTRDVFAPCGDQRDGTAQAGLCRTMIRRCVFVWTRLVVLLRFM
jgi:hypothetical protein